MPAKLKLNGPLPPPNWVRVGRFKVVALRPGRLWITNGAGEGMETPVAKLEQALAAYWRKEF